MVETKHKLLATPASGWLRLEDSFSSVHNQQRRRHWLDQLYAMAAGYILASLFIMANALLTQTSPNREYTVITEVGVLLLLVPLLYFLRYRIVESPYRASIFYFLTACSFPMVAWVWYLDGGIGSPTTWVFFLPLVYMAILFSPRAIFLLGAEAILCYMVGEFVSGVYAFGPSVLLHPAMLGVAVLMSAAAARGRRANDRERRQLAVQLEKMASTDTLTGCLNHKAFMEVVKREAARSVFSDSMFSLLLIDVDNFKTINDRHGHITGDEVLRGIARALQQVSLRGDVVGRPGGDEFALLVPHTDGESARLLGERLRTTVNGLDFPFALGISVGVSCLRSGSVTSESAFRSADKALYEAKRLGRNRVELVDTTADRLTPAVDM